MITYHCRECGNEVEEYCQYHPSAIVDSIQSSGKFLGILTEENGNREEREFETYEELCRWFASYADRGVGIAGYENGQALPQGRLQDDAAAWAS